MREHTNLLKQMGNYLIWADQAIWSIIETLSEKEYQRDFREHGFSVHKTYSHLARDSWEWYHDVTEETSEIDPEFAAMSEEELHEFIMTYNHKWIELIANRPWNHYSLTGRETKIELSFEEFIFHICNHAAYHRGQLAMKLRLLGNEVFMTDYIPHRFAVGNETK